MATSGEIRDRALRRMGVLAAGDTARSSYASDLDTAYTEVYAQLETKDLVTWDSDEDIPNEFAHSVVALTAYARIDEYNVPTERYQRIVRDAIGIPGDPLSPGAEKVIRGLQSGDVVETPQSDYY